MQNKLPIIIDCEDSYISDREAELFRKYPPLGFILFARHCETPQKMHDLIGQIHDIMGLDVMILIDQEGGRVARMKAQLFKEFPSAKELAKSGKNAVFENYLAMGNYLREFGITHNCAPIADLYYEFAHDIIGDRAFSSDAREAGELARACANGLLCAGIEPIIKHIPGHGRALCDSHYELPRVDDDLQTLEKSDFIPFKMNNDLSFAMTAHIIFSAIDGDNPITLSQKGMNYIRTEIGFSGKIMSDDLKMKALQGGLGEISKKCLNAGIDILLLCNSTYEEKLEMIDAVLSNANNA